MRQRVPCCLGFLAVLVCLMGADTCDLTSSKANPGGVAGKLEGKGTYAADPANNFHSVQYFATETTSFQVTSNKATSAGGNWSRVLDVVAGTYDTTAFIYTKDKNGVTLSTRCTKDIDGVVVK